MKRHILVSIAATALAVAPTVPALAQAPAPVQPPAQGQAPAPGQAPVELKSTAPAPEHRFEIVTPGPSAREITRVPDADFYREDQRVPYQPAFIEPFVGKTKGGSTFGASAWTAPETPVGSLASRGYQQNNGWFGFGITFIWDSPAPPSGRPSRAR
jgi:hypothetical protein